MKNKNHAMEQAKTQLESIKEMIENLEKAEQENDDNAIDEARETIDNNPLEISVRSDWHTPGQDDNKPTEYMILLCTGGPAVRIIGDLNKYCEPETAKIEFQDWFTPWENMPLDSEEENIVLKYAQNFYFGE